MIKQVVNIDGQAKEFTRHGICRVDDNGNFIRLLQVGEVGGISLTGGWGTHNYVFPKVGMIVVDHGGEYLNANQKYEVVSAHPLSLKSV